jgi:hypothetical protein
MSGSCPRHPCQSLRHGPVVVADDNVGEVPPNYRAFRRQQERWASGSARTCKEYFGPILRSPVLSLRVKRSLLRQNAYYTAALAVEASTVWAVIALVIAFCSGPAHACRSAGWCCPRDQPHHLGLLAGQAGGRRGTPARPGRPRIGAPGP